MKHTRPDYNRIQDPEGKIPNDEPVFLIRGQDRVGADAVRTWAKLNLERGGDAQLTELAISHAELMDAWPKKKAADLGRPEPLRYRLPAEREGVNHHFTILAVEHGAPVEIDGYLTANVYDDGELGEIFLKMEKQGAPLSGFADAWAIAFSMLRQQGTPLKTLLDKFENMRFEPSGRIKGQSVLALSPVDYVCKYLRRRFL